jgi:hypothetical protein
MRKVDMSSSAVTARLKRVAQLRRLCLSLQKAKLPSEESRSPIVSKGTALPNTRPGTSKSK